MYAFAARKDSRLFESLTRFAMIATTCASAAAASMLRRPWLDAARKVVAGLPGFVDEFDRLLGTNGS